MSSTTEPRNSAGSDRTHRRQEHSAWAEREPTKGCKAAGQKSAFSCRIATIVPCDHLRVVAGDYHMNSPANADPCSSVPRVPRVSRAADSGPARRSIDAPQGATGRLALLLQRVDHFGFRCVPAFLRCPRREPAKAPPALPRSRVPRVARRGARSGRRACAAPGRRGARSDPPRPSTTEHATIRGPGAPAPPTARSLRLVDLRRWP